MSRITFRLGVAAFVTILVFVLGFLLGSQLFQSKLAQVQEAQSAIQADTLSIDIEAQLASDACNAASLEELAKHLESLGPKIDFLEKQARNNDLVTLKKYYSLLEIKHWLAIKNMNKNCKASYVPVLFFYSNANCNGCAEQGTVLLHQKTTNPQLMIYSLDVDLDLSAIKILKSKYGIAELPTVVIGEQRYSGLQDADNLNLLLQVQRMENASRFS